MGLIPEKSKTQHSVILRGIWCLWFQLWLISTKKLIIMSLVPHPERASSKFLKVLMKSFISNSTLSKENLEITPKISTYFNTLGIHKLKACKSQWTHSKQWLPVWLSQILLKYSQRAKNRQITCWAIRLVWDNSNNSEFSRRKVMRKKMIPWCSECMKRLSRRCQRVEGKTRPLLSSTPKWIRMMTL